MCIRWNTRYELSYLADCKSSSYGTEYAGTLSSTIFGLECQPWSSQTPHQHSYTDINRFPDNSLEDASNYCRNPVGSEHTLGPWCYTSDPDVELDYCDIPACDGNEIRYMIIIARYQVHQYIIQSLLRITIFTKCINTLHNHYCMLPSASLQYTIIIARYQVHLTFLVSKMNKILYFKCIFLYCLILCKCNIKLYHLNDLKLIQ